jgi:hypothetical protein
MVKALSGCALRTSRLLAEVLSVEEDKSILPQNVKARDEPAGEAILIPVHLARSLSLGLES